MDSQLNDIQRDIQSLAAKFGAKEIAPIVDQDEANSHFRKELFPKFGEAGLIGITIDPEFGGSGLGALEYSLVLEEIAYHSSAYATSLSVTALPLKLIADFGVESLKKTYVERLVSGELLGAFCLTEASSGSDASGLRSSARRSGDHYILNGTKQFITNGEFADVYVVMARTGSADSGAAGVSAFVVERSWPGVSGGKLEKKMGMRASPTQEMIFDNVKVPAANLLSKEGDGLKSALRALDGGRISIAAIANGLSRAALDTAIKYAKEREQFGKKIIEFQGVSFLLADMATKLAASQALTRIAADMKDHGESATKFASMAKLHATEACMRITTDAVQVLGGYGYIEEYRVERFMREAKMLEIVEGTSQIQRVVIARNL
jgi:alkylation response protein AidB-like acyl-CoA dehydrogenase